MNAAVNKKRIDIRKQRIEKIRAESEALLFVKIKSRDQILIGFREDFDLHATRRRISFFARSQSINEVWPEATRACRSFSAASCQSGDFRASELRLKSSQSASMARSFSGSDIFSRSSLTDMQS